MTKGILLGLIPIMTTCFALLGCRENQSKPNTRPHQGSTARRVREFKEMRAVEDLVVEIENPDPQRRERGFTHLIDVWKKGGSLADFVFGGWGFRLQVDIPDPKSAEVYLRLVHAIASWLDTDSRDQAGDLLYAITDFPPYKLTRDEFIPEWKKSARFKAIERNLAGTPEKL